MTAKTYAPELVIAFVAPSGTSFEVVAEAAADRLEHYGYQSARIRLSDYLGERCGLSGDEPLDERTSTLQTAGDELRANTKHADALAYIAVNEIRANRRPESTLEGDGEEDPQNVPADHQAYLVWSLKHPREVETLRNIYGSRFLLMSVYVPREDREDALARHIAESRKEIGQAARYRSTAVGIITKDEHEPDNEFGQDVRDAYPLADFFVDGSDPVKLKETMNRAIDIAFGAPFATPTKDEYGMFFAQAAAVRSAELGRQVGAAITTGDGDLVATGTNEVPRPMGGQYWVEDHPEDYREFRLSSDTSDRMKRSLTGQIFEGLKTAGWIAEEKMSATSEQMYSDLTATRLRDLIEFGRAVHAELGALTDAARRGVPVKGHTMYVTTFPCHHCARHVVAAGIGRLVYIYPYPKSLAADLHGDAIQTDKLTLRDERRVRFEPFLGVAPRQYLNFFTMSERKDQEGRSLPIEDRKRIPRLVDEERTGVWSVDAYIERELLAVRDSANWLVEEPAQAVTTAQEEKA